MDGYSKWWVRLALLNLCIIALLGTIMRYKIAFSFPYLDQKFLQEGHSHFAFAGWITHILYVLLFLLFRQHLPLTDERKYRVLILFNLVFAYGMLFSFIYQGYGMISIFFASLSLLTGYVFAWFAFKDANRLPPEHPSKNWIKASIGFAVLSSLGTLMLSQMMISKRPELTTYLGSVYFYLHFQYNGWFIFACIALFLDRIRDLGLNKVYSRYFFWSFFISAIPSYFLSVLWAHLPSWLYALVILAAMLQVTGWVYFIRMIRPLSGKMNLLFPKAARMLLIVAAAALTLKIVLQLLSTIPTISHLAFGFRPIVIAYLHLVMLLIVSMTLLALLYSGRWLVRNKKFITGLFIFAAGAILNEIVLAVQGIGDLTYTAVPHANEILFCIALLLFISSLILLISQRGRSVNDANYPQG
jgi:hypothetical protein